MPYLKSEERTEKLDEVSNQLFDMFVEFYQTGNAKYINYVISKAAIRAVNIRPKYEVWRETKSVLQDVLDEFKNRMGDYERQAREKNGDII